MQYSVAFSMECCHSAIDIYISFSARLEKYDYKEQKSADFPEMKPLWHLNKQNGGNIYS